MFSLHRQPTAVKGAARIEDVDGPIPGSEMEVGVFYRIAHVSGPGEVPVDYPAFLKDLGASDEIVAAAEAAVDASPSRTESAGA